MKKLNDVDVPINLENTQVIEAKNYCLNSLCGRLLNGVSAVDGSNHVPREGDGSICAYCCTLMIFNADLSVRIATDKESKAIIDELKAEGLM